MKKTKTTLALSITALLFIMLYFFSGCTGGDSIVKAQSGLSVYDRVLKDSTIRCGYTIYPPGCMKDSATGKLSGVFIETLEKAASSLGLKVKWVEEVGWATQIEGLDKDRYDMIGSSVWANSKRAKLTTLSLPLYFSPIGIYVRSEDTRFDNITDWSILNDAKYKISVVDGGTGDVLRKSQFSKSTPVALPETTDFGVSFLDIVNKKADLLFLEPYQASKFIASNGYKVKNVAAAQPLHIFGNCYMFKRNEPEFEHMLNTVLQDLINNGYAEQLLTKYEKYPGSFLRSQKPFILK